MIPPLPPLPPSLAPYSARRRRFADGPADLANTSLLQLAIPPAAAAAAAEDGAARFSEALAGLPPAAFDQVALFRTMA